MKKKVLLPIILAIIGLFAGGATYAINIGNTTINDSSTDTTQNFINQMIPDDIVNRATLSFTCTQDTIPETHTETCRKWNLEN